MEAVKWYRKAADQGSPDPQVRMGAMYYDGHGVPQDYAEAAKWSRKAADQGFAPGQDFLGGLYEQGQGVPHDYVQAHMWFNLAGASSSGDIPKEARKDRDAVAAKMTPAQLAKDWKPTQT